MANDFKMDYGGINYPDNYDPLGNAVSDSTLATGISVGTDQIATSGINYNGADAAPLQRLRRRHRCHRPTTSLRRNGQPRVQPQRVRANGGGVHA